MARKSNALSKFAPSMRSYFVTLLSLLYIVIGWWYGGGFRTEFAFVYLVVAPLVGASLLSFRSGLTWKLLGGLAWVTIYVPIVWPVIQIGKGIGWAIGKASSLLGRMDGGGKGFTASEQKAAGATEQAVSETKQAKKKTHEAGSSRETSETPIKRKTATEARRALEGWLKSARPNPYIQTLSALLFSSLLLLWLLPIFRAVPLWILDHRLQYALVGLATLFIGLTVVEIADNYFPKWDFLIVKVVVGLLFSPAYWLVSVTMRITFLRPASVVALLDRRPTLQHLYYPVIGFLLLSRRYLLFAATVLAVACAAVIYDSINGIAALIILALIAVEWKRLIVQLADVRFLGFADLSDFSELLDGAQKSLGKERVMKTQQLRYKIYIHAIITFSRDLLTIVNPEKSYLRTVSLILVKHVVLIGLSLAGIRYFYSLHLGIPIHFDVELVARSFTLLFGEVTFDNSQGWLSALDFLGVASSFLLLGLGLTYLSGKAEKRYEEEYRALQKQVHNYNKGGGEAALDDELNRIGLINWRTEGFMGLMRLGFNW